MSKHNASYNKSENNHHISGSTVCIAVMYIGWVGYVAAQAICYWKLHTFLPMEITYGTAALFLVETVSLVRLKMAKEGLPIKNKIANPILQKIGIQSLPDFEEEVQEEVAKNQAKNEETSKVENVTTTKEQ